MKQERPTTANGYNMFEVSSLIQKAIRRRHYDYALFAAHELYPKFRNYLWKRLLTVSAEDCYGMVTTKVVDFYKRDCSVLKTNQSDTRYISHAVCYLLEAKKNRDADYYACNVLNSRDRKSLCDYLETEKTETEWPTKNGHDVYDLGSHLSKAIDASDDVAAGYSGNELFQRYRQYLWLVLKDKARESCIDELVDEIEALRYADSVYNANVDDPSPIWASKAIVLLLRLASTGDVDSLFDNVYYECHSIDEIDRLLAIPRYVYDCHTYMGKVWGMTKEMFIKTEQAALNPRVSGAYDHASWERFFELCKIGFYDKEHYVARPSEALLKEFDACLLQPKLF